MGAINWLGLVSSVTGALSEQTAASTPTPTVTPPAVQPPAQTAQTAIAKEEAKGTSLMPVYVVGGLGVLALIGIIAAKSLSKR
jgi:hypothetical protein